MNKTDRELIIEHIQLHPAQTRRRFAMLYIYLERLEHRHVAKLVALRAGESPLEWHAAFECVDPEHIERLT